MDRPRFSDQQSMAVQPGQGKVLPFKNGKPESESGLLFASTSEAGLGKINQDARANRIPEGVEFRVKGSAFAVADGISSSDVGADAAQIAVDRFVSEYYAAPTIFTAQAAGLQACKTVNELLLARTIEAGDEDRDRAFACTFSGLVIKGSSAFLFHVGDSRITLLRNGVLQKLTTEHVFHVSSDHSVLSRAFGIEPAVNVDYATIPIEQDDIFILTSDGLHNHVEDADLLEIATAASLDNALGALVDRAKANGGEDDLTVLAVRIADRPEPVDLDSLLQGELLAPTGSLAAGDMLDGFRILRPLHQSSRSRVYLALAPDGAHAIIKTLTPEMAADPAHRRRFMLEEWIANHIDCPNVMKAGARALPATSLYTVFPYFPSRTLRQWMADQPGDISLDKLRDIISQIIVGVRAIHRKGMLHQDIRPENILIDEHGAVKIIDFGNVYVPGLEESFPGSAGLLPGTFQYTAPEYFSGGVVSERSDQYSIGVIAYELVAKRLPYRADVAKIRTSRDQGRLIYRSARDLAPSLPIFVDDTLKRAAHPDPTRRFDALSEFEQALSTPTRSHGHRRHVPLAERDPVRFWRLVSSGLALLCAALVVDRLNSSTRATPTENTEQDSD